MNREVVGKNKSGIDLLRELTVDLRIWESRFQIEDPVGMQELLGPIVLVCDVPIWLIGYKPPPAGTSARFRGRLGLALCLGGQPHEFCNP
jgi:hypothetical protein